MVLQVVEGVTDDPLVAEVFGLVGEWWSIACLLLRSFRFRGSAAEVVGVWVKGGQ